MIAVTVHEDPKDYCPCSRPLEGNAMLCNFCVEGSGVMDCAARGEITENMIAILKPFACPHCPLRFADSMSMEKHAREHANP